MSDKARSVRLARYLRVIVLERFAARSLRFFVRAGAVAIPLIGSSVFGQALFQLGTLGGSSSFANGVNDSGQVTGFSDIVGNAATRAFIYSNGTMSDLGTLGGYGSIGYGINNSGQVTGTSDGRAFLYSNGSMTDLGALRGPSGQSQGFGINDAGQVTGSSYSVVTPTNNGQDHAFVATVGGMSDIGTLGGFGGGFSEGYAINASGQITGHVYNPSTMSRPHAFLYSNGSMVDLGILGGRFSRGTAINDSGTVAGWTDWTNGYGGTEVRAFQYTNGTMYNLGTLGGDFSSASDINNSGVIVGTSITSGGDQHAFVYTNGAMRNLNVDYANLLSDGSSPGFLYLVEATSISNNGFITGNGIYFSETEGPSWRGFLLDTRTSSNVPESGNTLLITGLALVGLAALGGGRGHVATIDK